MPVQIGQRPDHDFTQPLGLLTDCHRRIERFLSVLVKLTAAPPPGPLTGEQRFVLSASLVYFRDAAPKHTADEESSLFPRLRETGSAESQQTLAEVARLEADHARADALHREVDDLGSEWLAGGTLSPEAFERLRALVAELSSIYAAHIELEDTRIFPLAARVLSTDTQREIGREMAARRTPR